MQLVDEMHGARNLVPRKVAGAERLQLAIGARRSRAPDDIDDGHRAEDRIGHGDDRRFGDTVVRQHHVFDLRALTFSPADLKMSSRRP